MAMDEIRKTILNLLNENGATMKEASLAMGRSHSYLQQFIERGIPQKLKEDDRRKLAKFLKVPESKIGGPQHVAMSLSEDSPTFYREVAEYDVHVSAGGGALVDAENIARMWPFNPEYLQTILGLPGNQLAILEVRGDSMEPTLSSGDRIMVNMADKQVSQPGIFVLWDGGGTVIKRVEKIPGQDRVVLISDNALHSRYEVDGEGVEVVGRVVWAGRRL